LGGGAVAAGGAAGEGREDFVADWGDGGFEGVRGAGLGKRLGGGQGG